jgi:hypothetical protein
MSAAAEAAKDGLHLGKSIWKRRAEIPHTSGDFSNASSCELMRCVKPDEVSLLATSLSF